MDYIQNDSVFIQSLNFYILQKKLSLEETLVEVAKIKPKGRTLLSYAAEYGTQTLFELLLPHTLQKDIDRKDPNGRTPLSYAAANGHFKIFNQFFKITSTKAGRQASR